MAKNNNLTDFITDLANAIRAKCKTTGSINPQDFSKFVGGMPFFKFLRTVDITSPANVGKELPISFNKVYVKGIVYLTNDNGQTTMGESGSAMVIAQGMANASLLYINNTTERIDISGYPMDLPANYIGFLISDDRDGQSLIDAGWHLKIDIYEMFIGNPDGENTKMNLNNATGGGV